jgi:hypothetical protein
MLEHRQIIGNPAGRLLGMPDGSRIFTLIDQLDAALKGAGFKTWLR